ncbi:hypothetical protein G210_2568 [Candida maltosa Xu316]|uniref:T6SS Phospholipase effector Tle1-like catalytic domain-containing protein n=1 Tax=Candida maltosa (strain Xu316) TaxID=1245528 RepID=M3JE89_CANMX|nr:hypothetical protein G210_2568 [Candida maltosa Xu316]
MSSSEKPIITINGKEYSQEDIQQQTTQFGQNGTSKSIILCFDGTENEFGPKPFTNVLKLFRILDRDDPNQICYYQPGIGSSYGPDTDLSTARGFTSTTLAKISNRVDSFIAFTLEKHVMAAYSFLSAVYNPTDKIYLFGFRGSFTARIIAGMMELVGLVNYGLHDMTPLAWKIYTSWEYSGQPSESQNKTMTMATEFRKTFSRANTRIYFMGLWDSVNSVGVLWDKMFPYTVRTSNVDHIRHAVSLDERRAKFKQQLFATTDSRSKLITTNTSTTSSLITNYSMATLKSLSDLLKFAYERISNSTTTRGKAPIIEDLVEIYFPGNHGDVGGGWNVDPENQVLSNIPLRWMLAQAIQFGVRFQKGSIGQWSQQNPCITSFLSHHHDVLKYINRCPEKLPENSLPKVPLKRFAGRAEDSWIYTLLWWILELVPFLRLIEDNDGHWKRIFRPNLGNHRLIADECHLHWSIFYRLHYVYDYNPRNIPDFKVGEKFLNQLSQFKNFNSKELKKYSENLTMNKIKSDWTSDIWKKIPDELQVHLDKNRNL